MIRCNPRGDHPQIDKTAYVDPLAVVIGKVRIGKNVFVAPGAVIRADEPGSFVSIGENSNVQDRVVIHALGKSSVIIGKDTSLSHGCIVHGPCRIGKRCFVGFGSVVFKSRIKDGVFVKFMAAVLGVDIPSRRIIPDAAVVDTETKAGALGRVTKECREFSERVLRANLDLLKNYREEA